MGEDAAACWVDTAGWDTDDAKLWCETDAGAGC